MSEALIYLDPDSALNLQNQIRQKLVDAILSGVFPPGYRLPGSRKLADQLGVARNTVVSAYEQLIEEGYLLSRERSGIYVSEEVMEGRVGLHGPVSPKKTEPSVWTDRFKNPRVNKKSFICPDNWQQHPYPFVDGQFDTSLYPLAEWREATRLASGVKEIHDWSTNSGDADDPKLIEEICTKILPRRGIQASANEILITVGTQQALYLVSQLFIDETISVAIEEPGYPDMRELVLQCRAKIVHQSVDEEGIIVDENLDQCQFAYVTPSHQVPKAVTMSMQRRQALLEKANKHDLVIIEDDFESESNYLGNPHPALKSLDTEDRVIYVSSLSKVMAPGLRLGFMVASSHIIEEARALRRLMLRHPPLNNQRAAAFFLSLGHYDAFMRRLNHTFGERWTALRDALNHYMRRSTMTTATGGTSCWVYGPEELDAKFLVREAAKRGILIEPVEHYYALDDYPKNCFRMGITGIPVEKIRQGVENLENLIRDLVDGYVERLDSTSGKWLKGDELHQTLQGSTLLLKTVYGDPCTIELHPDGKMIGRAGYADEDCDEGHWRVEGDHWCRQWDNWSYGELSQHFIVIHGNQIKWFNQQGVMIDTGVLIKNH